MFGSHIKLIPHQFKYPAMPFVKRKAVLPERNVCSIKPARDYEDCISTGNGFQQVDVLGDPYNDELALCMRLCIHPDGQRHLSRRI